MKAFLRRPYLLAALIILWIVLPAIPVTAQLTFSGRTQQANTCLGSVGEPILYETFGKGQGYGPEIPAGYTTLGYQPATCPFDGNYALVNYTSGCWASDVVWHSTGDHTQDGNGYFMLVNASYTPSDFYTRRVDNLCEGTTYQFGAWLLNMCSVTGTLPNITFTIETTGGEVLARKNTGDIPITNPAAWKQDTLNFTTPAGVSSVILRMRNNAPGGVGNDVGLDDISFRPIGPQTNISVQGFAGNEVRVCDKTVTLHSTIENCYLSNSYQWQKSVDSINWNDIANETLTSYTVPSANSNSISYYRLLVAQQGNIGTVTCRVNSNTITVISGIPLPPLVNDTSLTLCSGMSYTLPSGQVISRAGTYRDTVRNRFGCDSLLTNLQLALYEPVRKTIAAVICDGDDYLLPSGKRVNVTGTYADTLYRVDGCDSLITTCTLTIIKAVRYSSTVAICPGASYKLPSGATIFNAGIYSDTLRAFNNCDSMIATIRVAIVSPVIKTLQAVICGGQDYPLPSGKMINKAGVYNDTLKSTGGCDSILFKVTVTESSQEALRNGFLLPAAFTPNQDGLNDCFGIAKWGAVSHLRFAVYNRWGQRLFYSTGTTACWDGRYKGLLQPAGTYVYSVTALTACGQVNRNGVVVLMR